VSKARRGSEPRPFNDPLAEQLAWLMDSAIGIGPFSFGLDALIGLIPGLGDLLSSLVSGVIVMRAMQAGVNRAAILRMLANIGIDTLVGSIPLAGDLFDVAYKSNIKNLKIYRESLTGDRGPLRDWGFVALVIVILLLIVALPVLGLVYVLQLITS
jgi:Domain of unknown function (DUF4112)